MGSTTYTTTSSVSNIIIITIIADCTKLRCFLILLKVLIYQPVQCRELSTKILCNSIMAGRHTYSLLLLYDINIIVYTCMHIVHYIMIVCNYSLVNAYMYTSRFMAYQVQDSLTLSFCSIVLVVLVLLNANIFIYDGG